MTKKNLTEQQYFDIPQNEGRGGRLTAALRFNAFYGLREEISDICFFFLKDFEEKIFKKEE